jgi:hypothetical protein
MKKLMIKKKIVNYYFNYNEITDKIFEHLFALIVQNKINYHRKYFDKLPITNKLLFYKSLNCTKVDILNKKFTILKYCKKFDEENVIEVIKKEEWKCKYIISEEENPYVSVFKKNNHPAFDGRLVIPPINKEKGKMYFFQNRLYSIENTPESPNKWLSNIFKNLNGTNVIEDTYKNYEIYYLYVSSHKLTNPFKDFSFPEKNVIVISGDDFYKFSPPNLVPKFKYINLLFLNNKYKNEFDVPGGNVLSKKGNSLNLDNSKRKFSKFRKHKIFKKKFFLKIFFN